MSAAVRPVLETASGKLSGITESGVTRFLGAPYARAPVGPLRFRPPQPPEPWQELREALAFGGSAPQVEFAGRALPGTSVGPQSEDCLYLNVWTPAADVGAGPVPAKRPVLVWLHGGGFTSGSGSQGFYDPTALVRRSDVVVVTLNYRLGALGFLHLGARGALLLGATSNVGLLDQIEALAWVRDHAAALGGDPENVTIFGESSGARSVATLLGTPAARGLFQRAIAQSGGASHGLDEASACAITEEFLRELELPESGLERLRELPVAALLEAQSRVVTRRIGTPGWLPFQPVVDGVVLPEPPLAAIRAGLSRLVELIVGSNRDEWKLFAAMDPRLRALDEAGLVERVRARVPDGDPARAKALLAGYRGSGEPRVGTTPLELFCALETDRVYRIPALRLADAHRLGRGNVYAYQFTRPAELLGGALGACHAAEVAYVFGNVAAPSGIAWCGSGPEVDRLCASVMDAWTSFARDGVPRARDLPDWRPYTTERRETLVLGTPCSMELDPGAVTRRLWDGIP
ncbi:MAG: carboxylesterase/lipase family protein [Myxococcota bacterium]